MSDLFRRFARSASELVGSPTAFVLGVVVILGWLITGPLFGFSDTWQLVINTATTVVTFLMVFIIQNSQNRDAKALHLKLDELLRAIENARTTLVDLENQPDENLSKLQVEFEKLSQEDPGTVQIEVTHRSTLK